MNESAKVLDFRKYIAEKRYPAMMERFFHRFPTIKPCPELEALFMPELAKIDRIISDADLDAVLGRLMLQGKLCGCFKTRMEDYQ